jgi:hypothetical protein
MEFLNSVPLLIPILVVALLVGFLTLVVLHIKLSARFRALNELWDRLSEGLTVGNLEQILQQQLRHSSAVDEEIHLVKERLSSAEVKLKSSKRYVGLVRYDAFNDVGGGQSFSMAVFDEEGDGAVVTSQVGRMDCRVFGKLLRGGRSDTNLTAEEDQAIEEAVAGRSRPKIGL